MNLTELKIKGVPSGGTRRDSISSACKGHRWLLPHDPFPPSSVCHLQICLPPHPALCLPPSLYLILWLFSGPLWLHWVYLDNSGWNHLSVLNLNTPESLLPWKVTYLQIPGIATWVSLRAIIILTSGFVIKIVNWT